MATPHISILLPVFDAAQTLELCLRSILRQREARWECVVVDDGSRDASPDIARAFAQSDPRIRVLPAERRGLIGSLERGLAACRAPFVARMDADDWMHRERLGLQLRHMEARPELSAVGCHVRLFPRALLTPGRLRYESWLNSITSSARLKRDAFVECPIAHPSLFIRRDVLLRFGYQSSNWPEDYDLILRLLEAGRIVDIVPRRLLGWRDHPERLSRTGADYRIERFTACKAAYLARSFLREHAGYILWGYGHTGRSLRRALLAHGRQPTHIVELHPGRIGQTIHGAPVIPPAALVELERRPIVVSVAGAEPRERIRSELSRLGFAEESDFLCAA